MLLLRPHSSAIFPSSLAPNEQRGPENRGAKEPDAACCCLYVLWPPSLPPDAPFLLGTNATKIHLPNKQGTAALQDWLLALALKVSKARFRHELDAKCVLGGLLPPRVHAAVSSLASRSWATAGSQQLPFIACARRRRTELQQSIAPRRLQSQTKQRGTGLGLEGAARKGSSGALEKCYNVSEHRGATKHPAFGGERAWSSGSSPVPSPPWRWQSRR